MRELTVTQDIADSFSFVSSSSDFSNVDVTAFIAGPVILNYPFVSGEMNPFNVSIGTGLSA